MGAKICPPASGWWCGDPAAAGLKLDCHLLDTKLFSQEQPYLNSPVVHFFRYSCAVTRIRYPNFDAIDFAANDLLFCSFSGNDANKFNDILSILKSYYFSI